MEPVAVRRNDEVMYALTCSQMLLAPEAPSQALLLLLHAYHGKLHRWWPGSSRQRQPLATQKACTGDLRGGFHLWQRPHASHASCAGAPAPIRCSLQHGAWWRPPIKTSCLPTNVSPRMLVDACTIHRTRMLFA